MKFFVMPADAKIFVDGAEVALDKDGYCSLKWGKRKVEVRKEGFKSALLDVEVDKDTVNVQSVILVTIEELNSQEEDDRPTGKSDAEQLEAPVGNDTAVPGEGAEKDNGIGTQDAGGTGENTLPAVAEGAE